MLTLFLEGDFREGIKLLVGKGLQFVPWEDFNHFYLGGKIYRTSDQPKMLPDILQYFLCGKTNKGFNMQFINDWYLWFSVYPILFPQQRLRYSEGAGETPDGLREHWGEGHKTGTKFYLK